MLIENPYVIVIAMDFSKAFNMVRHSSLLEKVAQLNLPDSVYNWLVDYFERHMHSTHFQNEESSLLSISASIIQGSGVGPASYVVTSSDLRAITPGNLLCKYADDTYLIVPPCNADTRSAELLNVDKTWAKANNLRLNQAKTVEIIFTGQKRRLPVSPPPPLPEIVRVSSIKILGVTVSSTLSVTEHVSNVVSSCAQTVHALRTLRAHGMPVTTLHIVFRSVVVAKLMYAASAWYGFTTAADQQRLDAVIRRGVRSGLCAGDQPPMSELVDMADESLFTKILQNRTHVLHQLLPPRRDRTYELRHRRHDRELFQKVNSSIEKEFVTRMLFKCCY
jgi:hypothetical protein